MKELVPFLTDSDRGDERKMMAKYHVTKAGKVAACRATSRPCPLGGHHFANAEDAQAAVDMRNEVLAQIQGAVTTETPKTKTVPERAKSTSPSSDSYKTQHAKNNLKELQDVWESIKDEDPSTANELSELERKIPYFSLKSSPEAYAERQKAVKVLEGRWKQNLFEAFSFTRNPELNEKIYDWAYAEAHSSGLHDVEGKFEEYSDLTGEVYDAYARASDRKKYEVPFPGVERLSADEAGEAYNTQGRFPYNGTDEEKQQHADESKSIHQGFLNHLASEYGYAPEPVVTAVYYAAYEDTHSSGYYSVENDYADKFGRLEEMFKIEVPKNY